MIQILLILLILKIMSQLTFPINRLMVGVNKPSITADINKPIEIPP